MHSSLEPIETVLIVDDDVGARLALSNLLRSVDLRVLLFASAEELLAITPPEGPTCLVLDVRLKGLSGLALQSILVQGRRALPIIFISGYADVPMAVGAMKAGAVDFIEKPFRDQEMLEAVREALKIDIARYKRLRAADDLRQKYVSLTPRERDVMALVTCGLLNKQVADRLGLSVVTVKIHRRQVMRKMTAGSFAELVRMKELVEIAVLPRQMPDGIPAVTYVDNASPRLELQSENEVCGVHFKMPSSGGGVNLE
ncbi:response regulator transcription factor [Cupriavidus plantarum]|uniref:response regulator transcription factor n=1 Tax=Cupriavidus plantarum TaxID=942865 RepID=UPI000E25C2F8|nr:FixJ family two-component response regulator [Cupriavidus plantarum]